MLIFSGRVCGLHVRPGNSIALGKSLRGFQEEVAKRVCEGTPSILLDAPVGSGKTIAALASAQACGGPSILTYPTNSLAQDQARSVASLLEDQYCVEILQLNSEDLEWAVVNRPQGTGHKFAITIVNGDILDAATKRGIAKGVSLRDLLQKLLVQYGRNWVMLTNVDLLVNAITGRYRHSEKIVECLVQTNLIVLDEFHFYRGPSLAAATWSASLLVHGKGSVLAMSGTLADPGSRVLPKCAIVRETGTEREDWPKVRWEVEIKVRPDPTAGVYGRGTHSALVEQVVEQIEDLVTEKTDLSPLKSPAPIAVVILNSPIDAMAVARKLRNSSALKRLSIDIFEAHGLMDVAERRYDLWTGNIVVGTSAIEVGIDFKTPILIAQAWDSYSFIQRFGRIGRSTPGVATFYTPEHLVNVMTKRFSATEGIPYQEFVKTINEYLEPVKTHREFVSSRYAGFIMSTLTKEIRKKPFITEEASLFFRGFLRERGFGQEFLGEAASKLHARVSEALMVAGSSLVRDVGLNTPAIIDIEGSRWFMEVDLVEASRWGTLELSSPSKLAHLNVDIPLRFQDAPIVWIKVSLDKQTSERPQAAITTQDLGKTGFGIVGKAGDIQLRTPPDMIRRLAEGLLCYSTDEYRLRMLNDWRIRGVHTLEGKILLLGANALLGKFLTEI